MKFSLLHPSRSRPKQAIANAKEWLEKAGNVEVEYILSIDTSDPKKFEYLAEVEQIQSYKICCYENDCVVQATNRAANESTGDVLIYLSDDFKCPERWGELLENEIKTHVFGDCWLLKVDDCLQKFHVPVLTIPIMSRTLYMILGYFWHPDYKSMFVDQDLYEVTKKNGWLKLAPHLKFPHHHPSNGKAIMDETYRASEKNWKQGEIMFSKRKALNFPI